MRSAAPRSGVPALVFRITLLGVMAGCVHNPFRPYKGWSADETKHVTVYTEGTHEHLFPQEWLEQSHAAYRALLPEAELDRVDVLWLRSPPGMLTRVYRPWDVPASSWAFETLPSEGRIGKNGLIVLETRNEYDASKKLAHLFIHRAIPNAPLWLHLGLAKYMAKRSIHYRGDFWLACFGNPVFDEAVPISYHHPTPDPTGTLGPVASPMHPNRVMIEVTEVLYSDWYRYDAKWRAWFEYASYAMVHFLIHGMENYHQERFLVFLRALAAGKSQEDALAHGYPHILQDEWDDLLAVYVRPDPHRRLTAGNRNILQGLCIPIPPVKEADEKPRRRPVEPTDIKLVMDDLDRIDVFRRYPGWVPKDIMEAEMARKAAGRGGRGSGGGAGGRGTGAGGGGTGKEAGAGAGVGTGSGAGGTPKPDPRVPTIETTAPPAPVPPQ